MDPTSCMEHVMKLQSITTNTPILTNATPSTVPGNLLNIKPEAIVPSCGQISSSSICTNIHNKSEARVRNVLQDNCRIKGPSRAITAGNEGVGSSRFQATPCCISVPKTLSPSRKQMDFDSSQVRTLFLYQKLAILSLTMVKPI
jgi:hypothetical protein